MALCSLRHLIGATKYSFAGLKRAWSNEQAFRHEVLLLFPICIVLFLLSPGVVWSLVLIAAWLAVLVVELLNSALEEAFDLISPEYNAHIKYGKDMASAAVFLMLVVNGLLWIGMLFS